MRRSLCSSASIFKRRLASIDARRAEQSTFAAAKVLNHRPTVDRIVGIETEYGCLVSRRWLDGGQRSLAGQGEEFLFRERGVGAIDLHYRDYEEPPGNGGFLLNGGRLYLDMGHIEYASPECLSLRDVVTYDLAGDRAAADVRWMNSASRTASRSSRTTSIITPARRSVATRIT